MTYGTLTSTNDWSLIFKNAHIDNFLPYGFQFSLYSCIFFINNCIKYHHFLNENLEFFQTSQFNFSLRLFISLSFMKTSHPSCRKIDSIFRVCFKTKIKKTKQLHSFKFHKMWKRTHAFTNYSQVWFTFHERHYTSKVPKVNENMKVQNYIKFSLIL